MMQELIRRILYGAGVQAVRRATGMKVHYRVQYAHDYGTSARWYLLRRLRLAIDGHRCTAIDAETGGRCHATTTLQAHHTSYAFKGAAGLSGFLAELSSLRVLCDKHHSKETR